MNADHSTAVTHPSGRATPQPQDDAASTPTRPDLTVLVLTGTSEHPFDRLIRWVDDWFEERTAEGRSVTMTIQRGASTLPTHATSVTTLTTEDLRSHAVDADVIICHGGPGTIHDALSAGIRPIVVPRLAREGEHVDDHQVRFASFLGSTGSFAVAQTAEQLVGLLDEAVADPRTFASTSASLGALGADPAEVGRRITRLVDSGRRPKRRRLPARFRQRPDHLSQLDVLAVCSSGGHLRQLWRLMPWLEQHRRHWVTFDTVDATSLLQNEPTTRAHAPTTRNIPNLLRNARLAWRHLRTQPPDVIISSGAGVAVPFFWLSRLLGIPTVYIEVFDRVDSPTLTGRLCAPVTDLMLVQWDEQEALYRRAVAVGHLL